MKKILNALVVMASILYIGFLILLNINGVYNFIGAGHAVLLNNIKCFTPVAIIGTFLLVNLFGKGVIKITLFVIYITSKIADV